MSKVAVIFKSKYGSTQKYAKWIADALKADLIPHRHAERALKENDYDTFVYGGGLYAYSINGISLVKKHSDKMGKKKLVIFAVGAGGDDPKLSEAVKDKNLKALPNHDFYLFRGSFDYGRLSMPDKLIMQAFKQMSKSQDSQAVKEIIDAFSTPQDWCRREYILPLVKSLK